MQKLAKTHAADWLSAKKLSQRRNKLNAEPLQICKLWIFNDAVQEQAKCHWLNAKNKPWSKVKTDKSLFSVKTSPFMTHSETSQVLTHCKDNLSPDWMHKNTKIQSTIKITNQVCLKQMKFKNQQILSWNFILLFLNDTFCVYTFPLDFLFPHTQVKKFGT